MSLMHPTYKYHVNTEESYQQVNQKFKQNGLKWDT